MGNVYSRLSSRKKVAPLTAELHAKRIIEQTSIIASLKLSIASQKRTILAQDSEISNLNTMLASYKKDLESSEKELNSLTEDVKVMLQKFHDLDRMVVGGRK